MSACVICDGYCDSGGLCDDCLEVTATVARSPAHVRHRVIGDKVARVRAAHLEPCTKYDEQLANDMQDYSVMVEAANRRLGDAHHSIPPRLPASATRPLQAAVRINRTIRRRRIVTDNPHLGIICYAYALGLAAVTAVLLGGMR